ncbi:hypothetical protein ZIOFF_000811 [Zingiber officinale]|uniref:Uncharacterized protein n=1 Tax=Zingiber officinale TaxID=94328 RepID=A0A8J5HXS3_ZINOF|nr:hypothetical protein ZIOFF_000811 [Zingiber officinale]
MWPRDSGRREESVGVDACALRFLVLVNGCRTQPRYTSASDTSLKGEKGSDLERGRGEDLRRGWRRLYCLLSSAVGSMELDSIECISVSDGITDDDEVARVPLSFLKPHGDGSGVQATQVISPVSRVHELLECPVCGHSMYPPIHQVRFAPSGFSLSMRARYRAFGCSGFCGIFFWFPDSSGIDVLFVLRWDF